jgi:hypothetical protein
MGKVTAGARWVEASEAGLVLIVMTQSLILIILADYLGL